MRTKSAGSTKGMGYITPSKPVGRLMLNFMALARAAASAAAMDGASSSAADDHLVEADRRGIPRAWPSPGPACRRPRGGAPHRRSPAGRPRASSRPHRPPPAPPGRARRRPRRMFSAWWAPRSTKPIGRRIGSMLAARGAELACRRCRRLRNGWPAAPVRPGRGRPSRRAARSRPRSARRRLSRPASCSMLGARGGEHDRDIARRHWPAAGRTPRRPGPGSRPSRRRTAARQIAIASPSVSSGRGDSMPAALRSAGAPAPRQRIDPAGIHLVEARRRHGDEDRMHRIRAHRHQRDLDASRGAERQRRRRDRIAQVEMAGDPQRRGAARLGGARLAGISAIGARPSIAMPNSAMGETIDVVQRLHHAPAARPARPAPAGKALLDRRRVLQAARREQRHAALVGRDRCRCARSRSMAAKGAADDGSGQMPSLARERQHPARDLVVSTVTAAPLLCRSTSSACTVPWLRADRRGDGSGVARPVGRHRVRRSPSPP